jgi:putative transposase
MARQPRIDLSGYVYHVINRTSGRVPIFRSKKDYLQFEEVLTEARERVDMGILAYCIMPNHFHIALQPKQDGDVQQFMGWFTKTQTQRWHATHDTIGHGHLYQGRYKAFIVNTDEYFITLMRYIEQNPLRAKLVQQAEDWQWGSLYRRVQGTQEQQSLLSGWPVPTPKDYLTQVNTLLSKESLYEVRQAVTKGSPFGGEAWRLDLIELLHLGYTQRNVGRPKNGS